MGLVDLLLPERCAGCGSPDTILCVSCRARLVVIRPPLCGRCGRPVAWPVERCRECAGRRLAFERARSAVAYEGPAVAVVGGWKEGGRRRLAREAAALVAEAVVKPRVDAVTFVPAVPDRSLWRGHNPAEALATALADRWSLPVRALLRRHGGAVRQRGLPLDRRLRNVADAFSSTRRPPRAVALVDDVYTTGSTVSAAARELRRAGAARVEVVTFARALRGRA